MSFYYVGIDPGKSGAITVMNQLSDNGKIYMDSKPFDEEILIDICKELSGEKVKCCLEKVNAMPGQGVTSMFNFGQNFGFIQGVLKSFGIPFQLVPPQKWKKEFSVNSNKNTSIECAKRLFPNISLKRTERCKKDDDGIAESMLMAEYARRRL